MWFKAEEKLAARELYTKVKSQVRILLSTENSWQMKSYPLTEINISMRIVPNDNKKEG